MKREEALKCSEEAIDELVKALEQGRSEELTQYLGTLARFHNYSFGNCLLIAMQRPEATHVAGFQTWKSLGRYVKKGENGIGILAPLVYKKKGESDGEEHLSEEKDAARVLRGFKVVHVFDVSQTEGKELPQFTAIGGDPGEKLRKMEAVIAQHQIELSYEIIPGGALGVSREGSIVVRPGLTSAETFAVLVHELAHEILHKGERRKETTKTVRETEAEAVAFVVCRAAGLECSTRSSDYIQLYAGDKEVLLESLEHIQKTASLIISELDCETETEEVCQSLQSDQGQKAQAMHA